jgi:uncharacterized LabA/DUF88 family protein
MESTIDLRLAVLIDADNVPPARIRAMLEEIAKYGTPTFKRIYGDWTSNNKGGWKAVLLPHAITPIQQYSYTTGKNATDAAMIIDAMDILYSGRVDGFCIVSSDSDFTRLATRLREAGMKVFGMGEKKTPIPFISACDKFIYIEILDTPEPEPASEPEPARLPVKKPHSIPSKQQPKKQPSPPAGNPPLTSPPRSKSAPISRITPELVRLIEDSINDLANEDGWVFLGNLGMLVIKKMPDFDPRNYGYKKLTPLIKSMPAFEVQERNSGKGPESQAVYVRIK